MFYDTIRSISFLFILSGFVPLRNSTHIVHIRKRKYAVAYKSSSSFSATNEFSKLIAFTFKCSYHLLHFSSISGLIPSPHWKVVIEWESVINLFDAHFYTNNQKSNLIRNETLVVFIYLTDNSDQLNFLAKT